MIVILFLPILARATLCGQGLGEAVRIWPSLNFTPTPHYDKPPITIMPIEVADALDRNWPGLGSGLLDQEVDRRKSWFVSAPDKRTVYRDVVAYPLGFVVDYKMCTLFTNGGCY